MPKKGSRTARRAQRPRDSVRVLHYEVTTEPIKDRRYKRLPRRVKDAVERLYHTAQAAPREAIPELREWIEKYPDLPVLYNYLAVAYSAAGQKEKANDVIDENYRRNPDYLFTRLNYAEQCLDRGDCEAAAKALDHKFDLKLLYPRRNLFHISEVTQFLGVVGYYFFEIGQRETAEVYYGALRQLAPDHLFTKRLRRVLHPNAFQRLVRRLAHPVKGRRTRRSSDQGR